MSSNNHNNLCLQSTGSEDDWKNLYEASFPQDERMSVTEVRTLLASGMMLLHKTTDGQGALQCFSLVTVLSNNVLLAYIATDQSKRSSGVGSKHMKALLDLLKKLYPTHLGLFLEIESTKEKNLPADEEKARKRRLAFYQRLQYKRMLGKEYLLPSYTPGTPARQGELLWSEFGGVVDGDATLKSVIHEIYTRAYNLPTSDPSYARVIGQFTAPTAPASSQPAATTPTAPASSQPAATTPTAPASSQPAATNSTAAVSTAASPNAWPAPNSSTVTPAVSANVSTAPAVTSADVADGSVKSPTVTQNATTGDGAKSALKADLKSESK